MTTIECRMPGKLCRVSILIAATLLPGCGPKEPVRAHVSGTVTLDGKPMADGFIYFKKVEEGAMDRLEVKDGKFEGMVEIGTRRVEVSRLRLGPPIKMGNADFPNQIETIAVKYNLESTLSADVSEDSPNEFTFDVKLKK